MQEDWIGLRALDAARRLVFDEAPGGHMRFTLSWFHENVIVPYLDGRKAINSTLAGNKTRWADQHL